MSLEEAPQTLKVQKNIQEHKEKRPEKTLKENSENRKIQFFIIFRRVSHFIIIFINLHFIYI